MTEIAIHTTAPVSVAKDLVRRHDPTAKVHPGMAGPLGQPDCFYGWGEARKDDACPRHTLIITKDHEFIRFASRRLVAGGFQCIATDAEDFSVPYLGVAACLYRDDHDH